MDLESVADELYVIPPSEFVQRRNELASEAQRSGDKTTAAAIKKLRKPTLGAWLANLLVHEHPDQTDELLHLGATLRRAQKNLAGPELRRLAQQRREVVGTLISEARGLARQAGQPVADDAARELEATLSAALADESAAKAFRSGHLALALEHVGFGPLERIPGGPEMAPGLDRRRSEDRTTRTTSGDSATEKRLRERRAAAERVVRDAQAAVSAVLQVLNDEAKELGALQQSRDERRREVSDLERRLQQAKLAEATSEQDVRSAQQSHEKTERKLRDAKVRAAKAEDDLQRQVRG